MKWILKLKVDSREDVEGTDFIVANEKVSRCEQASHSVVSCVKVTVLRLGRHTQLGLMCDHGEVYIYTPSINNRTG